MLNWSEEQIKILLKKFITLDINYDLLLINMYTDDNNIIIPYKHRNIVINQKNLKIEYNNKESNNPLFGEVRKV